MELDASAIYRAKTANLERLARRLGVELPRSGPRYHEALVARVAQAIEKDRIMAEAEERRQAERAEQKRIAQEIADALGETGPRPRRQIQRIVALMGEAWVRQRMPEAWAAMGNNDATPLNARKDGGPRTMGGAFFAVARQVATGDLRAGTIDRRQFFRCFFDRPPKPREKAKLVPKPKPVPVRRFETPVRQAQGKPKRQRTVPEVFVARRRA